MLWLLVGLLLIAIGLYLGFDHSLAFPLMFIGGFCALYGPLLYFFKRRERPKWHSKRPLSRDFISTGSTFPEHPSGDDVRDTPPPAGDSAEKDAG